MNIFQRQRSKLLEQLLSAQGTISKEKKMSETKNIAVSSKHEKQNSTMKIPSLGTNDARFYAEVAKGTLTDEDIIAHMR